MPRHVSTPSVTIVGGGLSGTLAAVHLLRELRTPCRVRLVERSGSFGPGIAYRTRLRDHLLNVRASAMGGIAGDPGHFMGWLRGPRGVEASARWGATPDPDDFLPRGLYADYLRDLLDERERGAKRGVELERIHADVVGARAERSAPRGAVTLADRRTLESHAIILALGNPPPAHPTAEEAPFYQSHRYIRDPWGENALDVVEREAPVLIVGSNLTMIDVAIDLERRGHRGHRYCVSRHGLLPPEHLRKPGPRASQSPMEARTARGLVGEIRDRIATRASEGIDWRSEVESIRWSISEAWRALPELEKKRLLRHARPFWEIVRHRAAPANMRDIVGMRERGQWSLRAARVHSFKEHEGGVDVVLLPRGHDRVETLTVGFVINATGPEMDYRNVDSPLIRQLLQDGSVRPGPLGIGLDASPDGALLSRDGTPSGAFSTLGPPLRGVLWETTAVPEIRDQAAALAERIVRSMPSD